MDPFPVPGALDNRPSPPHSPPQQRPSVAAASPAAPTAPPTLNDPPPYAEMIYAAIAALKKKGGSSKIAIGKHIEQSYSNLPANHSTLLTQHLQSLKNTGHLLMFKKSYKLPRCHAPVPETNIDPTLNDPPPYAEVQDQAQPISNAIDEANASVPKLRRSTRRPVGRPMKVQAQAQSISNAIGEANAAVPKSKRRTRRPVGRPMKVQAQVQPISNAIGKANAAVPKSKRRTRRPVGRPRKVFQASQDEVLPQNVSLANYVRCLREELQQVRDDCYRQVQALTVTFDLVEHHLTAANEKLKRCLREELQQVRDDCDLQMQALTAKLDLAEHQLRNSNQPHLLLPLLTLLMLILNPIWGSIPNLATHDPKDHE
ncbi:hypothetical protein LWI28_012512 [Acer negundo]|uniref:H15 domain-containing protein n=1 Tax=Acer negundo TaxID=4023 RepID=A0AAD5II57_ACENE|nr:hypothetical protein LWI28_012512 [Acer negundo]